MVDKKVAIKFLHEPTFLSKVQAHCNLSTSLRPLSCPWVIACAKWIKGWENILSELAQDCRTSVAPIEKGHPSTCVLTSKFVRVREPQHLFYGRSSWGFGLLPANGHFLHTLLQSYNTERILCEIRASNLLSMSILLAWKESIIALSVALSAETTMVSDSIAISANVPLHVGI